MKHLSKRILSCALALLLCLGLGAAAASAADVPEVTVTLSYADVTGFYVTPQTQFTIPANLSEEYGFDDDFGGEKVSIMDAIVFLHLLLLGDVDGLSALYDSYFDSWYLTNFMDDGIGAFLSFVNGQDPGLSAFSVEVADGDALSFFSIYDTTFWADFYTWFEVDGEKTGAVTVAIDEPLELTLESSMFGYPMGPIEDADILQLAIESTGDFNAAAFGDATVLATTNEDGYAKIAFAQAGTYYVSAASDYEYEPIMAPWLVVTVVDPALAQAKADAKAALDSYKNAADYRAAQQTELANAIAAGKAAIDAAADLAGVEAALANAKLAMDAIKTDAQLKAEEKPMTLLDKWHAKLPGWMKGVENLWAGFQYVILFALFGWIWFLF